MGISRSVEVAWGFKDKGPSRAPSRALPRMYKKSSKIRGHNGINNGHDDGEKSRLETIASTITGLMDVDNSQVPLVNNGRYG